MKKLFLALAFAGIVGAASATSILVSTHSTVVSVVGDEKKGDEKKKKDEKSCCKKDANGKTCSKEMKSCCKGKTEANKETKTPEKK